MLVTAVLCIRNEAVYLANCLRHLVRNGVRFAIIDHGSTDGSAEIYRHREFAAHLVAAIDLPFRGEFSLAEQLRQKLALVETIDSDWIIHLDADEVMHSDRPGETLREAVLRYDAEGWNVVNFDEFVFLPVEHDYERDAAGDQRMDLYYFFEPHSPRLMRAWRKAGRFSSVESGGHVLVGPDLRVAPNHLSLRHYIFRDQEHAATKYRDRTFAPGDTARGWHSNRINQRQASFAFPAPSALKRLAFPADRNLDRSEPWPCHYWERPQNSSRAHVAFVTHEVSAAPHDRSLRDLERRRS
jgi:glycosyltransferase involved in cell wall biosynthesis